MAIDLHYDALKKILYCSVAGHITISDLQSALLKITNSEEYPANVDAIWDMRQADSENVDMAFLENVLAIRQRLPERGEARLALIADSDLMFGLSRMYQMMAVELPQPIMIFRTLEEGENWLLC
jgi:hypothetical protein